MTKKISTGLGKGLGALIPSIEISDKGIKFTPQEQEKIKDSIPMIEVAKIKTNPYQPRKDFDKQALEDLKNSIIEHGVIQPITVRHSIDGYELVSGERRLRAVRAAGFKEIPAYIKDIDTDAEMLEIALIENVQREDLNPIEVAHGYNRLIEECKLTQEQLAVKVGKDRTTVTNFLRLLRLPEKIQESLRNKEITMGHARALLALSDENHMVLIWQEIINKSLSVRAVEALCRDVESGKITLGESDSGLKIKKEPKQIVTPEEAIVLADYENQLRQRYGTQVHITPKTKESGFIGFEFYNKEDLQRLLDAFQSIKM